MTATSTPASAGRLSVLANLRVKAKVFLGFLCVLAILVAVSATGFLSFLQVADQFATFAQRVHVVGFVDEIALDVAVVRRNVREFALTGEDANAETAHEIAKELRADFEKATTIIKNPERLEKAKEMAAEFETYMTNFDKVIELKHEEDKLIA